MAHEKIDHTHGDTGTKPPQSLNFQDGDYPDPEQFDWFWSEVPSVVNSHADALDAIDSDQDGTVDNANQLQGNTPSDFLGATETAANSNKVDGFDAAELGGGGGGVSLTTFDLDAGDYIVVAPFPNAPSNTTLSIQRVLLASDGGESTPAGLNVVVRDLTNDTNLGTYGAGWNDVSDDYSIGGTSVVLAVDNGQFTAGTGALANDVTAVINIEIA